MVKNTQRRRHVFFQWPSEPTEQDWFDQNWRRAYRSELSIEETLPKRYRGTVATQATSLHWTLIHSYAQEAPPLEWKACDPEKLVDFFTFRHDTLLKYTRFDEEYDWTVVGKLCDQKRFKELAEQWKRETGMESL